jgi:S-DNA-T family DNA segregation ATPase FtsK/SpoIIIE
MKPEHISEIKGIVILAIGLLLLASLISYVPEDLPWYTSTPNVPPQNWISITGAYLAGSLNFIFGFSSYALVFFLVFWSWNKFAFRNLQFSFPKFVSFLVLFGVISSFLSMLGPQASAERFERAGLLGYMMSDFLVKYIGPTGSYILLATLGTLALIITGEFLVTPVIFKMFGFLGDAIDTAKDNIGTPSKNEKPKAQPQSKPKIDLAAVLRNKEKDKDPAKNKDTKESKEEVKKEEKPSLLEKLLKREEEKSKKTETPSQPVKPALPAKPNIHIAQDKSKQDELKDYQPIIVGDYHLPSLDLLEDPPVVSRTNIESTLMDGAKLLEETLASFGVMARVADVERGPAITRYELEPAPGVKVQKFTTLSDDIALAMRAPAVRIVAPIPGKNRVGIEVPNSTSASVFLKEVLATSNFRGSGKSKLTLALGKDIGGTPMIADLAEMPHLLIAGTTGSGKTVCVNGIIMSMLFNASPDEVKFVLVDPKMVELAQYNDLPHLLSPTVTDPQKAAAVLNWVVTEMENRYKKLSKEGCRNIKGYNEKGLKMPYIVVIIDELADLMQVSAKTVESSITRLAQLSRAVGIHLILATQRPSVDVITGVIKANFPARISFKVASKVDSRTVLDANGAENLLGKGDMLFIKPGDAKPTRGQCNYVKDDEINRVIKFITEQQKPVFDETVLNAPKNSMAGGSDEKDELYDDAVKLIIETNQASVSILQRRFRLGYTRAARLIDMMEQNGLVGPFVGSKPRDILVDREKWLLENMGKGSNESSSEQQSQQSAS